MQVEIWYAGIEKMHGLFGISMTRCFGSYKLGVLRTHNFFLPLHLLCLEHVLLADIQRLCVLKMSSKHFKNKCSA
jgi:hypothetical protein